MTHKMLVGCLVVFSAMPVLAHPPLPPEALAACSGKQNGDVCSVTRDGQQQQGTCRSGPGGEGVACLPARPAPPAEAVSACSGKKANDSCSVQMHGQNLDGTCHAGPDGASALVCHPRRGGPGGRQPPAEALKACENLQVGAGCSVVFGGSTLAGTCRAGPDGGAAACMPSGAPPGR